MQLPDRSEELHIRQSYLYLKSIISDEASSVNPNLTRRSIFMYEFQELEELAKSAKQLSQMFTFIHAGSFGEDIAAEAIRYGAMSLYGSTLKAFADGLQDYFDRAYEDWKAKEAAA